MNVLDVFWTSYVRSIYVLCLLGCAYLLFLQKNANFLQIKEILVLRVNFLKLHMRVYIHTKFQLSSIILRQGVILLSSLLTITAKRIPKNPTQIRVKLRMLKCAAFMPMFNKWWIVGNEQHKISKWLQRISWIRLS